MKEQPIVVRGFLKNEAGLHKSAIHKALFEWLRKSLKDLNIKRFRRTWREFLVWKTLVSVPF